MKEEFKILEQNLEVLKKNSEKYKKTMKIRDIGVDTTNFNEFYNNSFNFKEIKSNYLSNLISFSFLKKVGSFYQWPFLCFSNLVENSIIHGKAMKVNIDVNCYDDEIYKRLDILSDNKSTSNELKEYNGDYSHKIIVLSIKDNGLGIETELFNKILFCFDAKDTSLMSCINNNPNYLNKNINIKSCCLRLGDSFFILSKTKNELNIG
jgi:signal transduction histidine kinase